MQSFVTHGNRKARPCHNRIHQIFTSEALAAWYNTLDRLLAHEAVQAWLEWVRYLPHRFLETYYERPYRPPQPRNPHPRPPHRLVPEVPLERLAYVQRPILPPLPVADATLRQLVGFLDKVRSSWPRQSVGSKPILLRIRDAARKKLELPVESKDVDAAMETQPHWRTWSTEVHQHRAKDIEAKECRRKIALRERKAERRMIRWLISRAGDGM